MSYIGNKNQSILTYCKKINNWENKLNRKQYGYNF